MLHTPLYHTITKRGELMDPTHELAQLRLGFVDPLPGRYEVIRPLVLLGDGTITQRAHETLPHPEAVRQEVDRLKTLYGGFHYRALARILSRKFRTCINDKTAKQLWQRSPVVPQEFLPLQTYHTAADRSQARLQVIQLYAQGWEKRSISQVLRVSRPTVNRWLQRFEAEHFAGLRERGRAPKPDFDTNRYILAGVRGRGSLNCKALWISCLDTWPKILDTYWT